MMVNNFDISVDLIFDIVSQYESYKNGNLKYFKLTKITDHSEAFISLITEEGITHFLII